MKIYFYLVIFVLHFCGVAKWFSLLNFTVLMVVKLKRKLDINSYFLAILLEIRCFNVKSGNIVDTEIA